MLQIRDIRKQYITGELVQTALDGVSLNLRDNEFVAILGPSGSGKTTLLNVIGGLDRYDSGDLIINGISTRKYSDRDWDSYRNHTIGFVFQSYNLIPHQSVLANVELALTISGISRGERRRRAAKALESVGLGNQLHKKPNQMSGGQMQRVAIARALVNDPDILLADEPTGALDSETSVQVMELLKEVSQDRLVVMVTHNPELAEEYANRIVRVKDGKIINDTNPFAVDDSTMAAPKHKNMGKSSMSFSTALSLSFNNLRTKLARTLLTAFAGSIGIIGIALIMSLSTGFQKYIDKIQEDTLSNYPLTIQAETADMGAAIAAMGVSIAEAEELPEGTVGEQQMITSMFSQIGKNDLESFKKYLDEHYNEISHTLNGVQYGYGIRPRIYSSDTETIFQVNPATVMGSAMGNSAMSAYMDTNVFYQMMDNYEMLEAQYQVVRGRWPENYNELVMILSSPNQITDYVAYALGMKDPKALEEMMTQVMQGQEAENPDPPMQWTYEDFLGMTFKLVDASALYTYNDLYRVWENRTDDSDYMRALVDAGEELVIVGVVCPREGVSATTLTPGVGYTEALTEHVIEKASASRIVASQLEDASIDVFTGQPFGAEDGQQGLNFQDMITVDEAALNSAFNMNLSMDAIFVMLQNYMMPFSDSLVTDTAPAQEAFLLVLGDMGKEMLTAHLGDGGKLYMKDGEAMASAYLAEPSAQGKIKALADSYAMTAGEFTKVYQPLLSGLVTSCITSQRHETGTDEEGAYAILTAAEIDNAVNYYLTEPVVFGAAGLTANQMVESNVMQSLMTQLTGFTTMLTEYIGNAFSVDEQKLASAFQFNMDENDLRRLMEAMSAQGAEASAATNLRSLGYADRDCPTSISIYMVDFAGKEEFLDFLDGYNADREAEGDEDAVIRYTDVTGIMMSSVRTIIDSVSYALIAFVAVSLVVSSIMIGIITYISVMERTKEIGILRAIGASKRNISQVFNAETFIIGLCSGLIGIGITLLLLIPGNQIIFHLTNNPDIVAQLPVQNGLILILLSMVLTLIGGFIPARQAARKDPVIALRSE